MYTKKSILSVLGLSVCAALLVPSQASAATFYLMAAPTTVDMPSPTGVGVVSVPMWGYASCTGSGAGCGPVTVPGPALTVPANDATLTVNLLNNLPQPTSLVVNGLIKPMAPVWNDGSTGPRFANSTAPTPAELAKRVRSFDAEASAGGTAVYIWNNVKPGTYLYQSGTQPQVQVQMGLYGAVSRNAVDAAGLTRAEAYTDATAHAYAYDNQATLLYSEIDPALHTAVGGAVPTYGTTGPTSTFNYDPKYFLINGKPYPGSPVITPAGNPGTTLLRVLNAGLVTHVPMIQGTHWNIVAEDGKPYPYSSKQYTALLPAAKSLDILLIANPGGAVYPVMDRRLNLSNNGLSNGGMLAFLQFGAAGGTGTAATGIVSSGSANTLPVAAPDPYNSVTGVTLSIGAAQGVLANDSDSDNLPFPIQAVAATGFTLNGNASIGGTYTLYANGSFAYSPPVGFAGIDSFTYQATDGMALSNTATVSITVVTPTAPSLASLDNFDRINSTNLGLNWNQTAGTAPPEPNIQIDGNGAKAVYTNLGGLAVWNPAAMGAKQGAGLTAATSLINSAVVLKATGGTAAAPANFIRVRCEASVSGAEVVVSTLMGGSNVSVYVRQGGFAAPTCTAGGALQAVVDANGLVTAFLNSVYVGGVQLPDVPAWKGAGNVGIQLQTLGAAVDNFAGGSL